MRRNFAGYELHIPVLVLSLLLALAVLLTGCGSNTPEGAVKKYLGAMQSGDWEAYKAAVVPQELTKEQEELARGAFKQVKVKVDGLKMETRYDESDKNKAAVILTDGKITYTAKILGETKSDTRDMKKVEKENRTLDTVRVKDVWYVDTKLGL